MKRPSVLAPDPPVPILGEVDAAPSAASGKRLRLDGSVPIVSDTVLTERMQGALKQLEEACDSSFPMLIEGDPGVGKTALVECFASLRRQKGLVMINMGEQTDAKSLVGLYAADETRPGFFRWIPGVLVEALRRGSWIVIEDAQLAAMEILSILLSVVESRKLFVHSTGETILAGAGFRVFATKTGLGASLFEDVLGPLWFRVRLEAPSEAELLTIIQGKYENVPCAELVLKLHTHASAVPELARSPLVRFMFRLLDRIAVSARFIRTSSLGVDEEARRFILSEAYDVYGAALPRTTSRQAVLRMIGEVLYIPQDTAFAAVFERHPELAFGTDTIQIGRVQLPRRPLGSRKEGLAPTKLSRQVLERLAVSVLACAPVLLVGETGTGKTTLVQELARLTGQCKLSVLNLSQQTEAADLIGGFRPLSPKLLARALFDVFERVFRRMVDATRNETYFQDVLNSFQKQSWPRFVKLIRQVGEGLKRKLGDNVDIADLLERVDAFEQQAQFMRDNVLFGYVEGALVEAVRHGHWILLDEINLASSETLEVLSGLLNSPTSSLRLSERGDAKPIVRHPDFRLFACMNPATDVSKRDLPPSIRYKFAEIYVDETDVYPEDLKLFIEHAIGGAGTVGKEAIAALYYRFKEAIARFELVDGSHHRPLLNLRTLSRALRFARRAQGLYGFQRALYEGFCLSFTTTLGATCRDRAVAMLSEGLGLASVGPLRPQAGELERFYSGAKSTVIDGYVLELGSQPVGDLSRFVLTPFVRSNVAQLARAIMAGSSPVLLEGPTSSGKTSLVEYVALATGHGFMRINNHEHTDLQEYLGAYQPDAVTGQLVFREGLLVEALRRGFWLVLDELNLAPSDVLEALNRLLDDNRELYVPELNEAIKPHHTFRLFATQNPAGSYGGRKALSRAFRSRFLELQVDDLPVSEVEQIIAQRCQIAPSYARKIGQVYRVLQERRQASANLFAGRHALITLRDLFRWANRAHDNIEQLAENGYMVLSERIRHDEEKAFIRKTIESVLGCSIDVAKLYDVQRMARERNWPIDAARLSSLNVTWTRAMQRTFSLVLQCILADEPVLLVGETGCGKTTVCQILSTLLDRPLSTLNCHQNTETSDILGCLRPTRDSSASAALFTWYDGPLLQSMKQGHFFLLDEISLAEDSVLERLNSVLEPQGALVLAEYVGGDGYEKQIVRPAPGFAIFATMNPGGDYGKKELSPALRNRFTEIWVPSIGDWEDVAMIVAQASNAEMAERMVAFLAWWQEMVGRIPFLSRWIVSLRDILSWARFAVKFARSCDASLAFIHAATMLFVDPALSRSQREDADEAIEQYKEACFLKLLELCELEEQSSQIRAQLAPSALQVHGDKFGVSPFFLPVNEARVEATEHALAAPTTLSCAYRVLRAMQLGSAVLLEGSPGVGKTTLIESLARMTGQQLVRINLSDQTDLIDLFGTDLPVEGGALGQFHWCDGPFLRALKGGHWILLDELNLASQSVLEGLNACLDHRGSVFIPELNMTFEVSPATRIFAAQNPLRQGGGRKGLPKSFVNRFITVWFDQLRIEDYQVICSQAFPSLDAQLVERAIEFNRRLGQLLASGFASKGRPWEFNLRDLFRWLRLATANPGTDGSLFARTIYLERLRTVEDGQALVKLYEQVFGAAAYSPLIPYHLAEAGPDVLLHVGTARMRVKATPTDRLLMRCQLGAVESLMHCLQHGWLSILVGPSGYGKTSTVRLLAELSGVPLTEFYLGPDTDTLELLGSFEQTDYERKYNQLASKHGVTRRQLSTSGDEAVRQEFEALRVQESSARGSQFEWVDGPLTEALMHGHWIVLENANLCSPAVLDRLNSLFEPNGSVVLNEASGQDVRVIRPHPDFRIFMTVDPRYGELSRAMRNRGVEIALIHAPAELDRFDLALSFGVPSTEQVVHRDLRDCVRHLQMAKRRAAAPPAQDQQRGFDLAFRSRGTFFSLGHMFALENQKAMLAEHLSRHADLLKAMPAVLSFMSWAVPGDFQQRLALLKDLSVDLHDKALAVDVSLVMPDYRLDLLNSSEFRAAVSKHLFGSSSVESIVSVLSPPERPVHTFSGEGLRWKTIWETQYSHFGFRDEEAHDLLACISGVSAPIVDTRRALLRNYRLSGSEDCDTVALRESLKRQQSATPPPAVLRMSPLDANIQKLKACEHLMSSSVSAPELLLLEPVMPASGLELMSSLVAMEHLVRDYCPLIDLMRSTLSSTIAYKDVLTVGDRNAFIVLGSVQRQLMASLLHLDLKTDKSRFIVDLVKLPPKSSEEIKAEIRGFVEHFVDPVEEHYLPMRLLQTDVRTWHQSDLAFQQAFQEFYYGFHQEDEGGVLLRAQRLIDEADRLVRWRPKNMKIARIKSLLAGLGELRDRENIRSVFDRLRGSTLIPFDLAVGPLLMLGQLSCNMIEAEPMPLYQSLIVRNGKWSHRTAKQLMASFECYKVAMLLGGNVEDGQLISRMADRLSNIPSKRYAIDEEDVETLFASSKLDRLNQHVATSLMDLNRKGTAEDLMDLADIMARHDLCMSPRLALLVMDRLGRPHKCAREFNHLCPQTLDGIVSSVDTFQRKVAAILDLYPEHDLLQSLDKMCQRVKGTPLAEATLFAMSSQLEFLLSKVQTWQSICVKDESLEREAEALMDVLFTLRKGEMESWMNLRDCIVESHRQSALSLWGWVTKLLLSTFTSSEDLLSLLDTYLLGCPVGEFAGRLDLLRHVKDYKAVAEANRIVAENCCRYYSQFLPGLRAFLEAACEPLLQELRGFLATIRWNDKNIVAHVECSKKVHSQVMKSYKALQELYQCSMSVTIPKLRLAKDGRCENTSNSPDDNALPDFDAITAQIFDRLAELKGLSSKDSVKLKQNAVVELFRLLKHIGIKLHRQFEPEETSIKALILLLPKVPESDEYLFKCLLAWSEMQGLMNSPHDDNVLRQVEIFRTTVVQLILCVAQFYKPFKAVSQHSPQSGFVFVEKARLLKLLSMNKALMCEASIITGMAFDAEMESISEGLALAGKPVFGEEELDRVRTRLSAVKVAFSKQFADLSPIAAAVQKNTRRLLVLLSRFVEHSAEPASAPEPFQAAPDEDNDFGIAHGCLQSYLAHCDGLSADQMAVYGRKLSKFAYVLSMVFTELLRNGFCRPAEEEDGRQEGDSLENADGVGMAQGTGEKDVSKEIEFEEQITDLLGEEQLDQPAPPKDSEGLDMDQDFEAELEDLVDEEQLEGEGGENEDEDEEKQQPKDEAGKHEGMDDQDQLDLELDQEQDLEKMSDVGDDVENHQQDRAEEFGEEGEAMDVDEDNDEPEGPEANDAAESDADLDEEPFDDSQDVDMEADSQDDAAAAEEEAGAEMQEVLSDEDVPAEEEEEEEEEHMSAPADSYPASTQPCQKDQAEQPASQEAAEDGDDANGQQEVPMESAATESNAGESTQQTVAQPLEQVLENMFKSVHSILEEDKTREKSVPQSMDLSRQQQFEHSTDVDNNIGLVSQAPAEDENRLRDKVDLADQKDKEKRQEHEEAVAERDRDEKAEGHMGRPLNTMPNLDHERDDAARTLERRETFDWDRIHADVSHLASELCEQLRLVLEPTKAVKLKGDYKTGKRLNLRKLIPYIISQYRKDKIWLRRTKPSKCMYRIALSVDNSRSMKDSGSELLALKSVALVSQALSKLEAGKLAIVGFGDEAKEIVSFSDPMISGPRLLEELSFAADTTNVSQLIETVIDVFARDYSHSEDFPWNLNIIISDGICEDHDQLRIKLDQALDRRIINIFVVLDPRTEKDSITELSKVQYVPVVDAQGVSSGRTTIKMQKYLETFPFDHYIILKNVQDLPIVLADSIRQWFELLTSLE